MPRDEVAQGKVGGSPPAPPQPHPLTEDAPPLPLPPGPRLSVSPPGSSDRCQCFLFSFVSATPPGFQAFQILGLCCRSACGGVF